MALAFPDDEDPSSDLSPFAKSGEGRNELSLRPRRLAEFIGQERLKTNLTVFIDAARQREEPMDHVLLYGPPGLGKTTLANIVANEMEAIIHVTSGPAIERPGDLVGVLSNLEAGAVLFIDEIHRLPRQAEEILYPAMEDRKVDIPIGKGPAARSVRIDLSPFTVIGATTRQGLLTGPLRDRFGIIQNFQFYDHEALYEIVVRSAGILGYPIAPEGAQAIARRSRGTPRIANRLLRRVRDFAQIAGEIEITARSVMRAATALEIDDLGLDSVDRRFLHAIIGHYRGGPVGLETLAATTGEDAVTLEDVVEPYLLQMGLLQRTPRGRVATDAAYRAIDLVPPASRPETGGTPALPLE